MKTPNPQGKGLVPILDSLLANRPRVMVQAKNVERVSSELFTSMFILTSQFQFRPIIGKRYWLYRDSKGFNLSLVSPVEWGDTSKQCIGECQLQDDMTWTLELTTEAANDSDLNTYLADKKKQFTESMMRHGALEDALPTYLEALPFHQRVLASSLAFSLKRSMQLAGIHQLSYKSARLQLPGDL